MKEQVPITHAIHLHLILLEPLDHHTKGWGVVVVPPPHPQEVLNSYASFQVYHWAMKSWLRSLCLRTVQMLQRKAYTMDSESQNVLLSLSLLITSFLLLWRLTAQKPAVRTMPAAVLCGYRLTPTACLFFPLKSQDTWFQQCHLASVSPSA